MELLGGITTRHYHGVVLAAVPAECASALDAGCGDGALVRALAGRCRAVIGIDADAETLQRARETCKGVDGIVLLQGDVMDVELLRERFDFVASIATLHHLELEAGLQRFSDLVAPGGTLAIVGLYRAKSMQDACFSAVGFVASQVQRRIRRQAVMQAPIKAPAETFTQIRRVAMRILPGAVLRRRLLFRYTLVWSKHSMG